MNSTHFDFLNMSRGRRLTSNCFVFRFNQEFLSTLENEQGKVSDASFEERLRYMGKSGKKKFFQLAKLFSFQRNKKISHHHKQPLCDEEK